VLRRAACCTEIEIINQTDDITDEEELAQDVISVITVFSARLYGKRSHRNRENIQKAKEMFADEQNEKAVQTDKVRKDDV
jgi:predicted site-specific integrase-resolvase